MKKALKTEEFIRKSNEIHNKKYDYSETNYISLHKNVDIICPLHGVFDQLPGNHLKGSGCDICAKNHRPTTEEFIERASDVHNDFFDYSNVKYKRSNIKIDIICPNHGLFKQTPASHLRGAGCFKCNLTKSSKRQRSNTEEFIRKAVEKYGNRYDYSKVDYKLARIPVIIICHKHGPWNIKPNNHLSGRQCPKCFREQISLRQTSNLKDFIKKSKGIHGDLYDYSESVYTKNNISVVIICPEHGKFEQTPQNHLMGSGCIKCGRLKIGNALRLSTEEFIRKSNEIHNNYYSYEKLKYKSNSSKVIITCPKHGDFKQHAGSHMRGHGCFKCFGKRSKGERELYEFIKSLHPGAISNTKKPIHPLEIDIYCTELRTGIEYCGLYWHSDGGIAPKHKNHLLEKHKICEDKEIRLITVFEDEWINKKETVKAFFIHLFGKSKKGVFARNVIIKEISYKQSKEFLEKYHLQGNGRSKYRIGAFANNRLIAVMTFGSPSDERGKTNAIEMKRFATDKRNHPGLGSKMFKFAVDKYKFEQVIAFVDLRWFTGEFKLISGFKQIAKTKPALFWIKGQSRFQRRHITKKELLDMEQFENLDLTKREMMSILGYHRIWDCGKLKLKWKNQ